MHPYASKTYVGALNNEAGYSLSLAAWASEVIIRPFAQHYDVLGSYPLACFDPKADLKSGLDQLKSLGMISVALVPDPLSGPSIEAFQNSFEYVKPFKNHLIIDKTLGAYAPSSHHRERIRRGLRRCDIHIGRLDTQLDDWISLYATLVSHRAITGMANFSREYFIALSQLPQLMAFSAYVGGILAGMTLWFNYDGLVYNHLTACNDLGYANGAAFALYDAAITHYNDCDRLNLGGGAGHIDNPDNGLYAFKSGFANNIVKAHICGAILDAATYQTLSQGKPDTYFPAYRA